MSKLLSSLLTKEQPWVICSGRSWQKSNRERIALDFFKKEQHQWFARDLNESLSKKERFTRKIVFFICFCQFFPHFMPKSSSLCRSLKKSDRERIAPLTLFKRATVSDSLPLRMTKEGQEWFALFHKRIVLSLTKTCDSLKKLMSEFPTLGKYTAKLNFWDVKYKHNFFDIFLNSKSE